MVQKSELNIYLKMEADSLAEYRSVLGYDTDSAPPITDKNYTPRNFTKTPVGLREGLALAHLNQLPGKDSDLDSGSKGTDPLSTPKNPILLIDDLKPEEVSIIHEENKENDSTLPEMMLPPINTDLTSPTNIPLLEEPAEPVETDQTEDAELDRE